MGIRAQQCGRWVVRVQPVGGPCLPSGVPLTAPQPPTGVGIGPAGGVQVTETQAWACSGKSLGREAGVGEATVPPQGQVSGTE